MNVYYQIRSSQLDRSIKGLKEHFRKNSSASGVPYSPAIPNKRKDTPTKKPIKRPGESPPRPFKHQPEGGGTCVAFGHPGVSSVGPSSCRQTGQKASVCPQQGPTEESLPAAQQGLGAASMSLEEGGASEMWRGRGMGCSQGRAPCWAPAPPLLSRQEARLRQPSSGDGAGQPSPPSKPGRLEVRMAEKWVGDFILSQPALAEEVRPAFRPHCEFVPGGGPWREGAEGEGLGHGLWCPG